MILYRFVHGHCCGPQIFVDAITFEQLFDFFHFWQDWWTSLTEYVIRFWSISTVTLTFNFQGQIFNLLYLSQKWSEWHKTDSKHINWTQMRPSGLTLAMTLKFQCQIWNCSISVKMVQLPQNEKQIYRLKFRPQMEPSGLTWAIILTLNIQAQRGNLLYLYQKWSYCHETKNKYIDWTLGLKWDHQVWPWVMTLILNFQGQIGNLLYHFQKAMKCKIDL